MQEYLIAFAVGGTICALSQLLMDKTKLMPGRIMVMSRRGFGRMTGLSVFLDTVITCET